MIFDGKKNEDSFRNENWDPEKDDYHRYNIIYIYICTQTKI